MPCAGCAFISGIRTGPLIGCVYVVYVFTRLANFVRLVSEECGKFFTSTLPRLACVVIQIQILVFSRKHCTESTLRSFLLFCNSQLFLSSRTNRAMARVICFRSDQLSTCVLQNCSWSLTTAGASLDKYCVFIAQTRLASFAQTTPTLARNLQSVTSWGSFQARILLFKFARQWRVPPVLIYAASSHL